MNRRVASAAGAMLLIGVGILTSPAFSQGPMAPRMDVAPPPRVAPPPPPPVFVPPVVPTPPPMPVAPVMAPPPPAPKAPTASAPATPTPATPAPVATPAPPPATASPQAPRATASASPPYADSQVKALRGVGVGVRGPGGTRQVTSDSNGVVSLGKLGPGRHELTVNPKSLGPGAQPVALVGLLLPAVQKLRDGEPRYRTFVLKPVNDQTPLSIRLQYDQGDGVSTVDLANGMGIFASYSVGDLVARLSGADIKLFEDLAKRNTSGETRLVFVTPVPGSTAAALADANTAMGEVSTTRLGTSGNPTGPDKPIPNNQTNPIPGIDIVVKKKPAGSALTQSTGGDGTSTLGVLTPGTHSVTLDTKKLLDVRLPGGSGSEPAQPAGILIALLLPAVQKLGEAPQPTTVEHSFPRSFLANARELLIDIIVPEGGGSPKVDWGDGSPQTDVGRDGVPAPSAVRVSADVSTIRVQALSIPQTGPGGPGTPTAQEAPISTSRSNKKHAKLSNVGVTARGPGGVIQARSDGEGWTRFGKLPIGNTVLEFNGADLASALTVTGTSTTTLTASNTGIVIGVIATIKTDGTPVVFTGSVPANDVKTLKANLRVGRDGNLMDVDWGNGPQLPQPLPRTGAATLTVPGPNGPIPLDPALVTALQVNAGKSAPGMVDANTAMGEVSTTRLGTSGNPTGPDKPIPNNQNNPIPGIDVVVQKKPAGNALTQTTGGDGTSTLGVLTPGTHSVTLDPRKLLDVRLPSASGSEPAQPAGVLIALLIPAVQKLGQAPQPTTVEHSIPRSVLANATNLQIQIIVPEGGGSPKVDWGDGSPQTDVGRDGVPAPSAVRVSADVSTIRVQALSLPNTGPGGPGTPTANEAPINTSRSNIKRPSVMLPNVGVTASGPGGVTQARSDGEGWTRFGKLPIGNTIIEFSGADLGSALKTSGAPTAPTPQQNNIELLIVITIIAIKTDGTPIVFTGSVPASAVKTVKADLRVGRDGNAMTVDFGNGPQLPQILPRTGPATLTVPGSKGPYTLEPLLVSSLQANAGKSAPGMVDANSALQEVSTTR
ncbi:hypothetical protein [Reyranella sp.]|uniref:hypothetical protein n=1 Tax=Reyranella sp. TaxID=1929291 RepID=UPI003BA9C059